MSRWFSPVCLVLAASCSPAAASYAVAALPDMREFPGYNKPFIERRSTESGQRIIFFDIAHPTDGQQVGVRITLVTDAKNTEDAVFGVMPLSGAYPPEQTLSGRRIGQRAWAATNNRTLYVVDGRAGVAVLSQRRVRFDESGRPYLPEVTKADALFAEELAVKILARLQAMGVTSKPAASAPTWAKKEVAERLAAIQKEKAAAGKP
jgi:hypothetical protein